METLTALLFGTPERFRASTYGFYIAGALILLLAYRIRSYRVTILSTGAILAIFYGQALYALTPTFAEQYGASLGGLTAYERMWDRTRTELPIMTLLIAPMWLVCAYLIDRMMARNLPEDRTNVVRGPWRR